MPQKHVEQHGTFHVTTCTFSRIPWLTTSAIPSMMIDNLLMTRSVQKAQVFGFCLLPDHMHILLRPGPNGLSKFMQSFKSQSIRDAKLLLVIPSEAGSRDSRLAEGKKDANLRGSSTDPSQIRWQPGYYDERIRDVRQLDHALAYVRSNAVKHRLVARADDWPWTSLHCQNRLDRWSPWHHPW